MHAPYMHMHMQGGRQALNPKPKPKTNPSPSPTSTTNPTPNPNPDQVLPACLELGGRPEVQEDGTIVYVFDELKVSALQASNNKYEP